MRPYKVSFTFCDDYRPKGETFVNVSLVVLAVDQFTALSLAWDKLSALNLPEPQSFSAEHTGK